MGLRCERLRVVYSSLSREPINMSDVDITKKEIHHYTEEHPCPGGAYSLEDFIHDVTSTSGMFYLPEDASLEMEEWVLNCLEALI